MSKGRLSRSPSCTGLVMIVDDNTKTRNTLAAILRAARYETISFASGQEFLMASLPARPACLLLDLKMPHLNGLEVQERILRRGLSLPIIFITAYGTVPVVVQALRAGALNVLTKPIKHTLLLDAVAEALSQATRWLQEERQMRDVLGRVELLTAREREVLRWLMSGLVNKEIASILGTSERTIKAHRGRIMEKTRATSIAALVLMARQAGVTPVPDDSRS